MFWKNCLKVLMGNEYANYLFRTIFIPLAGKRSRLHHWLIRRWRVSGKVRLTIHGREIKMYGAADDLIVDQLYFGTFDEMNELRLFIKLCEEARCFVDVGSNTGVYSVLCASMVGNCEIHAFEPYTVNAERLRLNLSLNQINNVRIHQCAVGDRNDAVSFFVPKLRQRISQVSSVNEEFTKSHKQNNVADYEEIEVPMFTLDYLFGRDGVTQVDLMKIDVESFELEVLLGARKVIERFRPFIICEIFNHDKTDSINKFLREVDYDLFSIEDHGLVRIQTLVKSKSRNYFLAPAARGNTTHLAWDEINTFFRYQSHAKSPQ